MARNRNPIRRAQAIVPFGVGAMHDFPGNQSLMASGLDAWPKQPVERLEEDRLARRLGIRYFRQPPPAPGIESRKGAFLPFVRFPLIHHCPRCGSMKEAEWNRPFPPKCDSGITPRFKGKPCKELPEWCRRRMVPIRFIVACPEGCIDDFPWAKWAHSKGATSLDSANLCPEPTLRIYSTGKAGLQGVVVVCESCKQSRSLMTAGRPDSLRGYKCKGNRPWFGPEGRIECTCDKPPRLVQRGGSNIYFAKVASSILIPPYSEPIRKYVDDEYFWSKIASGKTEGVEVDESRISILAEAWNVDPSKLIRAVKEKVAGVVAPASGQGELDYRYEEYKAIVNSEDAEIDGEFRAKPVPMKNYDEFVRKHFSKVILIEKLAETRALTGFSRLNPPPFREFDQEDQKLLWRKPEPWLPAIRVYGEGVFLEIDPKALDTWRKGKAARFSGIQNSLDDINLRLNRNRREVQAEFFVLHALAHVLIRRMSFECGYGSASLRERIYCRPHGSERMSGILIYTAAGDSEGTLGGLVQQGKPGRLERILLGALEDAIWCSSDPVCIESTGQGTDSLNLAACHACCLLPETSCEEGNRLLDRGALIGLPEHPELGFFTSVVEGMILNAGS